VYWNEVLRNTKETLDLLEKHQHQQEAEIGDLIDQLGCKVVEAQIVKDRNIHSARHAYLMRTIDVDIRDPGNRDRAKMTAKRGEWSFLL
jgi:dissimilatory sulfite reductase (desulfoviridin) alpha/beta subunit